MITTWARTWSPDITISSPRITTTSSRSVTGYVPKWASKSRRCRRLSTWPAARRERLNQPPDPASRHPKQRMTVLDCGAILGARPTDQGCTLANVHGAWAAGPSVKERLNGPAQTGDRDLPVRCSRKGLMPQALLDLAGLAQPSNLASGVQRGLGEFGGCRLP